MRGAFFSLRKASCGDIGGLYFRSGGGFAGTEPGLAKNAHRFAFLPCFAVPLPTSKPFHHYKGDSPKNQSRPCPTGFREPQHPRTQRYIELLHCHQSGVSSHAVIMSPHTDYLHRSFIFYAVNGDFLVKNLIYQPVLNVYPARV